MPPPIFRSSADDVSARPDSGQVATNGTEKLAELRYLIILTAHWASSDCLDAERRNRFRSDLVRLNRQYSDKIDEIAMKFGVQQAMDAQRNVERTVIVPHCASPSIEPHPVEQHQDEPPGDDHGWF